MKSRESYKGQSYFLKEQETEADQNESFLLFAGKFLYMYHLYSHLYFIVSTKMNEIRVYSKLPMWYY